MKFEIKQKGKDLARLGEIQTKQGNIQTPAFAVVGTKATVKGLTMQMISDLKAQVVLANTYHLYLQPGTEIIKKAGGLGKFMNWSGPTITDSGGFQVFSLGEAFGSKVSKVAKGNLSEKEQEQKKQSKQLCHIREEGADFASHLDGSKHHLSPEKSMQLQWDIGADIIFAFDECTSPLASFGYQREAMQRTHRWAQRSLEEHSKLDKDEEQALLAVVQGGREEKLRKESAKVLAEMKAGSGREFEGFGIGGSFSKDDLPTAVRWVNEILPENKPRHLLGIGEPGDILAGIEMGCDLFDCVEPTRIARHSSLYTKNGKINLKNAKFKTDFGPIGEGCSCYTCKNHSRAYLAHLFRAKELLAVSLASIHNLHFILSLLSFARQHLASGDFLSWKKDFLLRFYS